MKFDLASVVKRPSRRPIELTPIVTTKAQADDLARIYLRIVRGWQEATPRIIAAYETELNRVLQTDAADALGAALDGIAEEMQRLVLVLTPSLRDWAFRVERWHRGKFIGGILAGADVDLSTVLGPIEVQETVETLIQRNVALVRDVSQQARARIADAVFRGLQQKAPAREVAKDIREATGLARARSIRIAADQATKLGAALNEERQRQAGLDKFKWRHSGKLHPRDWHRARNGKTFPWEGSGIPADDMPSVPPFCGCTAQGVITFDD